MRSSPWWAPRRSRRSSFMRSRSIGAFPRTTCFAESSGQSASPSPRPYTRLRFPYRPAIDRPGGALQDGAARLPVRSAQRRRLAQEKGVESGITLVPGLRPRRGDPPCRSAGAPSRGPCDWASTRTSSTRSSGSVRWRGRSRAPESTSDSTPEDELPRAGEKGSANRSRRVGPTQRRGCDSTTGTNALRLQKTGSPPACVDR